MKKILAFLLVLAVASTLLMASCGEAVPNAPVGDPADQGDDNAVHTPAESPADPAEDATGNAPAAESSEEDSIDVAADASEDSSDVVFETVSNDSGAAVTPTEPVEPVEPVAPAESKEPAEQLEDEAPAEVEDTDEIEVTAPVETEEEPEAVETPAPVEEVAPLVAAAPAPVVDPVRIITTVEIGEGMISHSSTNGALTYKTDTSRAPVDISMMKTLEMEVYISDAAAGNLTFCIEIGSGGKADVEESNLNRKTLNDIAGKTLKAGWNHVSIDLSRFAKSGVGIDLTRWNWFRIFSQSTGESDALYTVKFRFAYFSMNGASLVPPRIPTPVIPIPGILTTEEIQNSLIGQEGIFLPDEEKVGKNS